jgi:hypothetical protein
MATPNYVPRGKAVTATYIHEALTKITVVFGLKRPSMSVQNLSFARLLPKKPSPLFSVIGGDKRCQDVLPASLFPVFGISPFLSCFKSEIRAGKLFVDPGHLQEEFVRSRPPIAKEEFSAALLL